MKLEIVTVPMCNTGLGREAGYANDTELLIEAAAERTELGRQLTSGALARLEAAEAELEQRFIEGVR